ncbi:MAG: type III-B CRISPR module RAMP protein Cmr1 [Armatimonadetes bacterium]|nr:type III-B CRISPR module RAMP protein Cmr1 [Armatimonadota bacterium]
MKPDVLTVTLRTVTPLFLGGADPNKCAELRPPSIKGVLRWWYRALDGGYRQQEAKYFGSTDEGQAPCLLQVRPAEGRQEWPLQRYRDLFSRGSGTHTRNGIVYLGYSLRLGENQRKAIPEKTQLRLEVIATRRADENARRAWAGALWLLGHLGGLGARSRRGLGTVALQEWRCEQGSAWAPILAALPIAHRAENHAQWQEALKKGLSALRSWFGEAPEPDHTCLGRGCKMLVAPVGFRSWEEALNEAGLRLQEFRQRRPPDYGNVRDYLWGGRLTQAPERAAFGMPLTFRFGGGRTATFQPEHHDRCASRLLIRVVQIGEKYHPLFVLLSGPVCPPGEKVAVKERPHHLLDPPDDAVLLDFFEELNRFYKAGRAPGAGRP